MSWFHHPDPPPEIIIIEEGDIHEVRILKHILREVVAIRHLLSLFIPRTTQAQVSFGGLMAAAPGTQAVGTTLQAVFQPLEADGVTITPGAVLSTPPTWSSSDPSIATVDSNGIVTGVAAGTATITGSQGVFTDADSVATAPLDASNTTTVTQPTGRTVSAQVVFE